MFSEKTFEILYQKSVQAKKDDVLQLASIVHDLKTPLNCIQGSIWIIKHSLLKELKQTTEKNQMLKYLKNFDISFEFLFSMIEDIQDLAKLNNNHQLSIECQQFNVKDFLDDVILLFEE